MLVERTLIAVGSGVDTAQGESLRPRHIARQRRRHSRIHTIGTWRTPPEQHRCLKNSNKVSATVLEIQAQDL